MELKSKKVILAAWGCENPQDTHMHQIWYLTLKKIFPNLETFDSKKIYFQKGREAMNNEFLETIKKQKPEIIIFTLDNDEFYLSTFEKLFDILPNTKKIALICDDDSKFKNISIFLNLFLDGIIQSPNLEKEYQKMGIKNAFFHFDYNTNKLKPLNLEKKFDLTFIGRPKSSRYKVVKYLIDNKINVGLFGWGWYQYPELKEIYQGPLNQEDYNKIINQSKIKLTLTGAGFSEEKSHFNMKGSLFEGALCGTFQLVEDYPGIEEFYSPGKEIGTFSSEKDLLKKIKYYLKNEKEREEIAKKAYKKTITTFNREKHLKKIFTKILSEKQTKKQLPKMEGELRTVTEEDFDQPLENLKEKFQDADYIDFSKGNNVRSDYKNLFQIYSLEKLEKPISCCDYYIDSFLLGDYLLFYTRFAFDRMPEKANQFIDINQLVTKKDFFMDNFEIFKKIFFNQKNNFLTEDNTAFVSFPLVRIKNLRKISYKDMEKAFEFKFMNILFSKLHKRKFLTFYPLSLLFKSISNPFILKHLYKAVKNNANWDKLKVNKGYMKDSIFEKYSKKES